MANDKVCKKDEETKIEAKKRSWKTYDSAPDTFIRCPNCFCGDTCGYSYNRKGLDCISQSCGLFHPKGKSNCITCKKEEEEKREQENQQKDSEIKKEQNKIGEEIHSLVEKKGDEELQLFKKENQEVLKNLEELVPSRIKIQVNYEKERVRSILVKTKGIYKKLSEYEYTHFNEVHSAYREIEKELDEIAKQKENKSDKTPEEEEELDNLKNKIKDLDKKQESSPTSYLP
nr:816_t:CDS:2 [Entrophospora candida]